LSDCNDPEIPSCGYFTLETAIDKNGERVSAMSAYLSKTVARRRMNRLSICTGTIASRLETAIDEGQGHAVRGVYIQSSAGPKPSKDYYVKARREVILTCGAMTTPQLLLLSGVGPKGYDAGPSSLGIPLVKELPAVGADFSDHYGISVMLELPRTETIHFLESAFWGLWYIVVWIFTGKGMMSLSTAPAAIFLHTDSIDKDTMRVKTPHKPDPSQNHEVPDIEIMVIPVNTLERAVEGRSLFSLFSTILQPKAKGMYAFILEVYNSQ
jgi:choline dehydrogenase-like flavoprotein